MRGSELAILVAVRRLREEVKRGPCDGRAQRRGPWAALIRAGRGRAIRVIDGEFEYLLRTTAIVTSCLRVATSPAPYPTNLEVDRQGEERTAEKFDYTTFRRRHATVAAMAEGSRDPRQACPSGGW